MTALFDHYEWALMLLRELKKNNFNSVKDRINGNRVDSERENIVIINQHLFRGWA